VEILGKSPNQKRDRYLDITRDGDAAKIRIRDTNHNEVNITVPFDEVKRASASDELRLPDLQSKNKFVEFISAEKQIVYIFTANEDGDPKDGGKAAYVSRAEFLSLLCSLGEATNKSESEFYDQEIPKHILDKFDPAELDRRSRSKERGRTLDEIKQRWKELEGQAS